MLSEELDNFLLLPFLDPIIPRNLAVMVVVLPVSVTPRVELTDAVP
jgi:hypothetical protein